jgi:hypothetical protein
MAAARVLPHTERTRFVQSRGGHRLAVSKSTDDPARVSERTLASFEAEIPSSPGSRTIPPARRPVGRQGALLLLGMIACIAVGAVTVFTWFL